MLFAAANVKFTDERVEGWPKGKEGINKKNVFLAVFTKKRYRTSSAILERTVDCTSSIKCTLI